MATITHVMPMGDQLAVHFDDGSVVMTAPTDGSIWVTAGAGGGGPQPGLGFAWPFSLASSNMNNGHPEDNFKTAGRPNHEGMDFGYGGAAGAAPAMPAANAGTVEVSGVYQGYGNTVIINHGNGVKTLYGHMRDNSLTKAVGSSITKGETMGIVGNTGNSFGQHLHFETWVNGTKIDPLIFMSTNNPNNDYIYA